MDRYKTKRASEYPISNLYRPSKPDDKMKILMLIEKVGMIGKIKKITE